MILTPPDSQQCTLLEADLSEFAARVDKQLDALSAEEAQIMAQNYDLLSNVASYSGIGYGTAVTYFTHHKVIVARLLNEIQRLHVDTYNQKGSFNNKKFFQTRQILFNRLDNALKTMAGRTLMGLDIERGNLKRSLGLNTKSLIHQLKGHPAPITDLPGFEKNNAKVREYGKILKRAGYVGLALDGVQSVAEVRKACTIGTEEECTKSKFSQGGRLVGSVGGGAGGGALASYVTCNAIFGLESAGTSLLWCGIVAGAVGGYFGSRFFSSGGEALGEVVYETTMQN